MRARSLLLVVLLILGGGMAAWFVRSRSREPLPAGHMQPDLEHGARQAREALESAGASAAAARAPAPGTPAPAAPEPGPSVLDGRVRDEQDAPVAEFDLEFGPENQTPLQTRHVESAGGAFRIEGLEPGRWRIAVHAPLLRMKQSYLAVELPHEPLLVRMLAAASVCGIVLDTAGVPVAQAEVRPERILNGTSFALEVLVCDAGGRFCCDELEPGEYAFLAAGGEFAAPSDPLVCRLDAGLHPEELRLRLKCGGTIEGRLAPEHRDIGEIHRIELSKGINAEDDFGRYRTDTDAQGRFRITNVPAGTWWLFGDCNAPGGSAVLSAECLVHEAEITRVVIGKPPADTVCVKGRVLDRGEPVAGASVLAFCDGSSAYDSAQLAATDDEGRYQVFLTGCGQATFFVSDRHPRFDGPRLHHRLPCVGEVLLDLEFSAGRIRGRVLGPDGEALPKEHVWAVPTGGRELVLYFANSFVTGNRKDQTDEAGAFEISGLAPGPYCILAGGSNLTGGGGAFGRSAQAVQVPPHASVEGLVLRLAGAGTVWGRVRNRAGQPCGGFEVYARSASGEMLQALPVCKAGSRGLFCCDTLAPGRYTFFARGTEQALTGRGPIATHESPPVEVRARSEAWDEESFEVELVAEPATIVRVLVTGPGDATPPCELRVLDDSGRELGGVIGQADFDDALAHGAFGHRSRFGPLPPGNYRLEARTDDGRVATQKFTLAGEPEKNIALRVE